jgi:CheY-like chemotaxis protein
MLYGPTVPIIFVMDQSQGSPSSLLQRLIHEGYHTLSLRNVREALGTLRCIRPDLLIVDAADGVMTAAADVLKALRKEPAYETLPVLLLGAGPTGYGDLKQSLANGDGDRYLYTTSSPDAVISHVRSFLEPLAAASN